MHCKSVAFKNVIILSICTSGGGVKGSEVMGGPSGGERGGGKILLLLLEGGVEGGEAITAGWRGACLLDVFNSGGMGASLGGR